MMEVDVTEGKSNPSSKAILHVLVIGFHHKKGAQVDFCHPPLESSKNGQETDCPDESRDKLSSKATPTTTDTDSRVSNDSSESGEELERQLPLEWASLPSLSLPDGAHNFLTDTVFFHLNLPRDRGGKSSPEGDDSKGNLVYCISCYKQVLASESIRERDSSVTRSTIMKSVVVMSRLPFYGLIAAKVESMTGVYFKQQNFGDISCLIELYNNLNYILDASQREMIVSPMETSLLSLSPSRHLLSVFGHRTLVLLKLLLLEKKVLFFLNLSSNPSIPSLTPNLTPSYTSFPSPGSPEGPEGSTLTVKSLCLIVLTLASLLPENFDSHTKDYHLYCNHCQVIQQQQASATSLSEAKDQPEEECNEVKVNCESKSEDEREETSEEKQVSNPNRVSIPCIKVFRDGNHIHPYICLSFIDDVKDCKGCIVGATNALFKQKKASLFDAFVDCQSGRVEFEDPDLKKQMSLTTEDLRFIDFLCRHSLSNSTLDKHGRPSTPGQLQDTDNFEGSDDWLRIQFNLYLLHALRTSFHREDSKAVCSFNPLFMKHWREKTENYKDWKERFLKEILSQERDSDEVEVMIRRCFNDIKPGHPGMKAKNANNVMNDMKLRFMTSYGHSFFPPASYYASSTTNGSASHSTESFASKRNSMVEAFKSSAKSTFNSFINSSPSSLLGSVIDPSSSNTGAASDQHNTSSSTSSACKEIESSPSIDSAHDALQSEFNSISFSSLLQKSEDESIEEVVYDRMKIAMLQSNEN